MFAGICKIWNNADGFAEQYRSATSLNLLSILAHYYAIIIDCSFGAPGHGWYVVDVLNANEKQIIFPGPKEYGDQMESHPNTQNKDASISKKI